MDKKNVKLRIYGMTCEDCAFTIKNEMEKIGAKDINIDYKKGIGSLKLDDSEDPKDRILKSPVFSPQSHYKAIIKKVE